MHSYCAEWPEFHPEFGLFCPSPRQRQLLRLATICLMTIMVVGASRVLAASHRPDIEDTYLASLTVDDTPPADVAAAPPADPDAMPGRPQNPCQSLGRDDMAGYFLNRSCKIAGRHGHPKGEYRVATFIIGHVEPQPVVPSAFSLRMTALEAPIKVADTEKRGSASTGPSAKKHKAKEAAPIQIARAAARAGGAPNTLVSAYSAETKRSHGPLDNLHGSSRPGSTRAW